LGLQLLEERSVPIRLLLSLFDALEKDLRIGISTCLRHEKPLGQSSSDHFRTLSMLARACARTLQRLAVQTIKMGERIPGVLSHVSEWRSKSCQPTTETLHQR
jgi:hypothetical protein